MKKNIVLGSLFAVLGLIAVAGYFVYGGMKSTVSSSTISAPSKDSKKGTGSEVLKPNVPSQAQIPSPPSASSEREKMIVEVRNELQSVMNLNEQINHVQASSSAQMLRIQEQAQIHQKILADIQSASSGKKTSQPSREALLAQEKLRVIREETMRNKKILESKNQVTQTSAT